MTVANTPGPFSRTEPPPDLSNPAESTGPCALPAGLLETVVGLAKAPHLVEFALYVLELAAPSHRPRLRQTSVVAVLTRLVSHPHDAVATAAARVLGVLEVDWWKKCVVQVRGAPWLLRPDSWP
jgi:hypothetical protein